MLEQLDKLPGTGQGQVFTADKQERGDVTQLALDSVDWARVTIEDDLVIEKLICATRDFAACVEAVPSSREGCCDCGHWSHLDLLENAWRSRSGLRVPASDCAQPAESVDTCPVYPDGSCKGAANGCSFCTLAALKAVILACFVAM
mmetsp:Transcript_101777/g.283529  ORF Transcript_101777/g.283529 Transcript_101777/m.283529 type:complete len:146 (+) Transcript_101777:3-440(+)